MSQNGCADFTVLSNCFIDEYMADANDAQLKIYLYLLRMVNAGQSTSISGLADRFNYTEKDIIRALKYWEKKKVLKLSFREDKSLESLQFLPISGSSKEVDDGCGSPAIPTPIPSVRLFTTVSGLTKDQEPESTPDPYEKPQYSLDQLKAFKSNEASSRLLFIAEQYLKKTLTPNEIKSIFFISDKLAFSEDLIDYLIQYCVGRDKRDFRYIEKVAINWAQAGITTPKQAARFASKYDKIVYDIMNALGKNTVPTDAEMVFIKRWTNDFRYDLSIIKTACDRTVLATDSHRFEYADKILTNWYQAGVRQKADIEEADRAHKKSGAVPTPKASSGAFGKFEQHDYDFNTLEKELLSNG